MYHLELSIKEFEGRNHIYGDHVGHLTDVISLKPLKNPVI